MVFWLAGSVGQMFSGFLQAAAYTHLSGVHGRAGWRWLFIVDGIITVPLALLGYCFIPNLPQDGKRTWWITEEERQLSVSRMQTIGRAGREPWTKAKVRRILLSWHTYLLRESSTGSNCWKPR
jgi:MFS family permease